MYSPKIRQIIKNGPKDALIISALRKIEDAALLKPAEKHIAWMEQHFTVEILDANKLKGISGITNEIAKMTGRNPVLIEIISHGSITGDRMCCDTDQITWADLAKVLLGSLSLSGSIVNAMSTCLSFELVESLCAKVPAVLGSNLTASPSAFNHIQLLYEKVMLCPDLPTQWQYTYCINNKHINKIDWKQRRDALEQRHGNDVAWKEMQEKLDARGLGL